MFGGSHLCLDLLPHRIALQRTTSPTLQFITHKSDSGENPVIAFVGNAMAPQAADV